MSSIGTPIDGLKVLLVDQHSDSLYLGAAVLENYNINVMPATSAEQALRDLPQCRPQLLITELCLPEQDGYFLLQQLRAREDSLAAMPAIALTTQASDRDRQRALAAGFQKHIAKPFIIEDLIKAIIELVAL